MTDATTTTLTPSATSVNFGTPVSLTASVVASGGSTPSGTVTFNDGSTSLASVTLDDTGTATTTASLASGTHSLTAVYSGVTGYSG